ncbi:hypothetical protein [Streptomyces sp. NBC_00094]|uniref:DUF7927 domain-containing protein n=1 Tax=Streptomyces sp. NBC_00094 TaxID=2903620 RepID=UPI002255D349|nr:hypothetical protein [Streptomyces sp. NBC_00094]MCX5392244.1 DUF11 domain-containing protein [Streptomyces sp. NBC_00094]
MRFRQLHLGGVTAVLVGLAVASLPFTAAGPASADVIEPFGKRYDESLYGDFTTLGNTVMGCPTDPADMATRCATAASGQGSDNNNTFVMRRLDAAGLAAAGAAPDFGSSTGHVRIPAGAEVAYARLFWGGNDGTYKGPSGAQLKRCDISGADVAPSPGDPATTAPVIKVGTGAATPVSIDSMVADPSDANGPHYYTGESDVTAAFAGVSGTDAQVAVGDIWAPNGKGCVAGWSLTVVHKFPGPDPVRAPERRNVYVYGGHVLQRSTSPATTITVDGFYRSGGTARASVTAYEGDWNTPGDKFLVDGKVVTEAHTGNTNNFFISEDDGAVAPKLVNNLSIDAKAFDIPDGAIPQGATATDLTFSTNGDTYVPSGLAFSVPVPDLEITKTASPRTVKPGDTLTYTITAKNISTLDYPNAKFSDDLTGNLDDADYNGDVRTDLGAVSYVKPRIGYVGDIPAGKTATVTYSVKIKDPPTGDGKLRNSVEVETPRSNCGDGSEDPSCAVTPVIESPKPTPTPVDPTDPPGSPDPTDPTDPTDPSSSPAPTSSAPVDPTDPASPSASASVPVGTSSPVAPAPGPHGQNGGSMAETGSSGERLWLLGALGVALAATGLVAKAAMRGRRDH